MVRIRKTNYLDKFKLKKMISQAVSFLGSDAIDQYTKGIMSFPFNMIHDFFPLSYKFLPESYVIEEEKNILGMITVSPTAGNPFKLDISRLFIEQNYFSAGKQLIEFVISRYGAKGASNFVATIDDSYDELLHLFVDGCGFRQCSSEQLWKMDSIRFAKTDNSFIRPFKNSDAQAVAMLYNDSIINHFRHSLSRTKDEYLEPFFYGLNTSSKFKYVIEDDNLKTIKSYFSLSTSDNINYVLDVTTSPWLDCSWDDIFDFAINQISKRKKDFVLYVKVKKYTSTADNFEKYLTEKEFRCIQHKLVVVKDYYKLIKDPEPSRTVLLFNEIHEKPVFKIQDI